MAAGLVRPQVLSLYKILLRESQKITSYNFRMYAIRRVRDAFRENKELSDANLMNKQIEYAKQNLEIIKRQAIIGKMFSADRLVIESPEK